MTEALKAYSVHHGLKYPTGVVRGSSLPVERLVKPRLTLTFLLICVIF